jgi:ketosteroid isomerase-like protein
MSRENVEVVREAWSAYAADDFDRSLECFAQEWVGEDPPNLPDHGTYNGREGVRERERRFREIWGDLTWEPVEFIDAGDDVVVAVVVMRGHGRGSDVPVEAPGAFVYEVRDGRIVRDRPFGTKSEALEAAGLPE